MTIFCPLLNDALVSIGLPNNLSLATGLAFVAVRKYATLFRFHTQWVYGYVAKWPGFESWEDMSDSI